ncbi:MAG: Si-specific NAD(P)(+) transhydrogenase [Candidatus Zixiibacteriota bacterium]
MIRDKFDIVVIGSGPAGNWAAIQACKLGKKAAIVERNAVVGGVCVHTGTLPSKTLRETSLYYDGLKKRSFYGFEIAFKKNVTVQELMHRKNIVVENEMMVIIDQLHRNGISLFSGAARFIDAHTIGVYEGDRLTRTLETDYVVIATGTRPLHLPGIYYDGKRVFDGESILDLKDIPEHMAILGGGVIGCEWASIFSKLDIKVTLIDKRERLLTFLDSKFADTLFELMSEGGIDIQLGASAADIKAAESGVTLALSNDKVINADVLLVTAGRLGNTDKLALENIGLQADSYQNLVVDAEFRTKVENVYAVGDVIGFPSLASTSMDQGRRATLAAFGSNSKTAKKVYLPFGIYTIPEISFVGETEESLREKNHPYETGIAHFYELPRGQINNDHDGCLKLICDRNTRKLLGVHIIGERATEIIHIGQAVMSFEGTIDYFVDTVFNYPTIADAYKTAALNGLNKLGVIGQPLPKQANTKI